MSIFIKGCSAPVNCERCPLDDCHLWFNPISQEWMDAAIKQRPDECPIIEVPTPHGNLIDEDEVYDEDFLRVSLKNFDRTIVIEAEPGQEKLSTLLNK